MNLKKPKFWDYKKPSLYSYLLLPFAYLFKISNLFKKKQKYINPKIKIICIGNIYVGGTGKHPFVLKLMKYLKNKKLNHVL